MSAKNKQLGNEKIIDIAFRFIQQQILDQVPKEETLAELHYWKMPEENAEIFYNHILELFESGQISWDREPLVEGKNPSQQIINELLPAGFSNPTLLPSKDYFNLVSQLTYAINNQTPSEEILADLIEQGYTQEQAQELYENTNLWIKSKTSRPKPNIITNTLFPTWNASHPIMDIILSTLGYLILGFFLSIFLTPLFTPIPPIVTILLVAGFILYRIYKSWNRHLNPINIEDLIPD